MTDGKEPKSKVTNIQVHPRFRKEPTEDDPNFERDQFLSYLDSGALTPGSPSSLVEDVLEQLEEQAQEKQVPREALVGMAFCVDCKLSQDRRSWFARWFFPTHGRVTDFSCRAFPRKVGFNSITGKKGYFFEGPQSAVQTLSEEAFPRCVHINPSGTCRLFKPKF